MYSSRSYFIYRIKNIFLSIIFPCFINSAFYLESTNNTWTGSSFLLLSSLGLFNFFFFSKFFFILSIYFNHLPLFILSKSPLFLYILGNVALISVILYLFLHVTPRVCQMNVLPLPIA